jgi:N-acetylglucosaminyl-diphospho-decaprenol L-rhamnosyltransferase
LQPITVVVVHRDRPEACAATARAFEAQGGRVLIVDNDSSPAARAALERDFDVLAVDHNAGFGPGANAGLRHWLAHGEGEWVGIAPHDVELSDGCVARLLDAVADRPRAGLVSAEFGTDERPVVDPYFGGIQRPAVRGEGWEDAGHPHGTLMLARRACLEDIGLFDERFFAYCEEADLGYRATQAGWEVGIVWGAIVNNPHQGSSVVVEYLQLRNSLLLVRTHFGRYRAFVRLVWAAVNTTRLWLHPSKRTPWFDLRARRLAIVDFLRGRFGPPPPYLQVGSVSASASL